MNEIQMNFNHIGFWKNAFASKSRFYIRYWTLILTFYTLSSAATGQVFINEFCSSNSEVLTDEDGDYEDWIELYNAGSDPVNLEGFFISDDASNPFKYMLPGEIIEPEGFLLIWASGKDRAGTGGEIHTNFRIGSEGEPLTLSDATGVEVDFIPATALGNNMSYGRQPDGADDFLYFLSPTAGFTNNDADGAEGFLSRPELLTPSGFYTEPFDLMISHGEPDVQLRYTLDGSVPDEDSPLYTDPLEIENRLGQPDDISAIPTTSSTVPEWYRWNPPMAPVYKGTSIRVRAFREGDIPSLTATGTYVVDPEADDRYDLGRVCLTLPEESLFGPSGIYSNHLATGIIWEREAHFELFEGDGSAVYNSDIGVRLHGGNSRRYAHKSLRLYFRGEYGKGEMDYNIFNDEEAPEIQERMILRNSGSEWSRTYFRDAFAQQLLRGYADCDFMNYRPLVTFINGEYWGILNIRERYDDNYIKNNYGYESHEIDMLEGISTPVYGSSADYISLRTHWQNADLNNPENFQVVRDKVDIDNFRDHHIHQIFIMNTDQPGKNVRFWKPKEEGGKWRWLLFDLDDSFAFGPHCDFDRNGLVYCTGLDNVNATTVNQASNNPAWAPNGPSQTLPLRAMIQSDFFKYDFINRFADLLNTAFLPERLDGLITEFDDRISPYMQEHYERWHRPEPVFRQEHLDLVRTFAENRKAVMEEDMVSFFQLTGAYDLTVDVQPEQGGYVKVNSIAIHPDSVYIASDEVYPWTGLYYNQVELPISARAAPGHVFSHWLETGDTSDTLYISPGDDIVYTAVFDPIPTEEAVHYWTFNEGDWEFPFFTTGGGGLSANNAVPSVFTFDEGLGFIAANARFDQPVGDHLRINNPENVELIFALPTTGYKSPVFSYEARRSGQGAGRHLVAFSTNGVDFIPVDSFEVYDADPLVYELDFSIFTDAVDNPDFAVRLTITEGQGGTAGNNRLDNVALDAVPFSGDNLPPGISEPLFRIELIAGEPAEAIELNALFSDPNDDPISLEINNEEGSAATFTLAGGILSIDPQEAGEAAVVVAASDGTNAPAELRVEVFVHPAPALISPFEGFVFAGWDENAPEDSYPDHMVFTEGRYDDTSLDTPLRFAYRILHDDYHPDDELTVGFPYNNTRRTRINGLGGDGISFINTGRGRDLGGAVAAVNTEGLEEPIFAWWTAGTVLPNSRVYRFRLQYRIGIDGPFIDVTNGEGEPLEYERNELAGHQETFLNILLPEEVLNQPYVQFLWRYYHTGEQVIPESGQRAMLRLDDLVIGTADFDSVYNARDAIEVIVFPNPATDAFSVYHELGEGIRAELFSIEGRKVFDDILYDGMNEVQVRSLASGVYVLLLSDDGEIVSRSKVMVSAGK